MEGHGFVWVKLHALLHIWSPVKQHGTLVKQCKILDQSYAGLATDVH